MCNCCIGHSSIRLKTICISKCSSHILHTLPLVRWFHWFPKCLHSCKWKILSADYIFIYWFRMHWAMLGLLQHFIELFTNEGHAHLLLSSASYRSFFIISHLNLSSACFHLSSAFKIEHFLMRFASHSSRNSSTEWGHKSTFLVLPL